LASCACAVSQSASGPMRSSGALTRIPSLIGRAISAFRPPPIRFLRLVVTCRARQACPPRPAGKRHLARKSDPHVSATGPAPTPRSPELQPAPPSPISARPFWKVRKHAFVAALVYFAKIMRRFESDPHGRSTRLALPARRLHVRDARVVSAVRRVVIDMPILTHRRPPSDGENSAR
jgi:hypothetical protein